MVRICFEGAKGQERGYEVTGFMIEGNLVKFAQPIQEKASHEEYLPVDKEILNIEIPVMRVIEIIHFRNQ